MFLKNFANHPYNIWRRTRHNSRRIEEREKKKRILFPIRFMFFTKHSQNTTTVARISIRNTKLLMLDEELNAAKNITHAWLESLYGGTAYDHTIQRLFMEVVKLGEGSKEKCAKKCRKNRIIKLSTYIQLKKVVNYYN